jgi:DNA segregation ATPase FtsK/SpoIIIE-like protein
MGWQILKFGFKDLKKSIKHYCFIDHLMRLVIFVILFYITNKYINQLIIIPFIFFVKGYFRILYLKILNIKFRKTMLSLGLKDRLNNCPYLVYKDDYLNRWIIKTNLNIKYFNDKIDDLKVLLNKEIDYIAYDKGYKSIIFQFKTIEKSIKLNKLSKILIEYGIENTFIKKIETEGKIKNYFKINDLKKVENALKNINFRSGKNFIISSENGFLILEEHKNFKHFNFLDNFYNLNLPRNISFLGYDFDNNLITHDMIKSYHWIVAGTTGSGKSNTTNTMIANILLNYDNYNLYLLDIKKVELSSFKNCKNTVFEDDAELIYKNLEYLKSLMNKRNQLFKESGVKKIEQYNKIFPAQKLNYIFVFVEEISELFSNKEFDYEEVIKSLVQIGRNTGFRIVLTTQYPKADIISTVIKANCVNRLCGITSNSIESNVILDNNMSNLLQNEGEMILKTNNKHTKIKTPYFSENDERRVINEVSLHSGQ